MVRLHRLGDVEACPQRAVETARAAQAAQAALDANKGEEKSLVKPLVLCKPAELLEKRGMAGHTASGGDSLPDHHRESVLLTGTPAGHRMIIIRYANRILLSLSSISNSERRGRGRAVLGGAVPQPLTGRRAGNGELALPYYAATGSCIARASFGFDETYHAMIAERYVCFVLVCTFLTGGRIRKVCMSITGERYGCL